MKALLYRLFGRRSRSAKATQLSLARALQSLLSREQFNQMLPFLNDPSLLPKAAQMLDLDERVLTSQVAGILGLPFAHRVLPSAALLPQGISLDLLQAHLSIPFSSPHGGLGIFTCNPAYAAPIADLIGTRQIMMAAWKDIRTALTESQKGKQESLDEHAHSSERQLKLAYAVLVALIEQAGADNLSEIRFERSADSLSYSYPVENGKSARGIIQPLAADALWEVLVEYSTKEASLFELENRLKAGPFVIRIRDGSSATLSPAQRALPHSPNQGNVLRFPEQVMQAEAAPKLPLADDGAGKGTAPRPGKVLVIDDNVTFVRVLERFFQRHDLKVAHALDGAQGLAALEQEEARPDVVVCDVHMPGMNGSDFLVAVRRDSQLANLPIIMLTSDDDIELKLKLLTMGADAYLSKNEDPRLLCVQAQRLIFRTRRQQAA